MKRFNVFEVFKNVLKSSFEWIDYSSVSIDSRNGVDGGIFFAMKGEKTDGNLYLENALNNRFSYCITTDPVQYEKLKGERVVLVEDSFVSLKNLAEWNLSLYKGEKIVITGSVGKTSTKALASAVLSQKYRVYEAFKNFNNELGISIVASNLDLDSDIAIFEIGTNSPGEIRSLSSILKPDIAVVTNIGHAHIGMFGDFEALKKEKLSISESLVTGGTIWLNDSIDLSNYDLCSGICVKKFGFNPDSDLFIDELSYSNGIDFIVNIKKPELTRYSFHLNHPYDHFVINLLPIVGIAFENNLHYEEIYRGILNFIPVDGRGSIKEINGVTVIDDTYNAGFEAMVSSIRNLSKMEGKNKIAILGEMAEIDGFENYLYGKLYDVVSGAKDINFMLCGKQFEKFRELDNVKFFENKEDFINSAVKIERGIYLVKASRGKKFEDVVDKIMKEASLVI
ncbi:MAG: UDP-N-acetylmuramoyl-tripeptide--D-alanyl-D-alanine ligase [Calditerrivibrio sp.]|nr:UDP-N-acetylmuramoyl-tripeptide--D-alanyl-D-alanine ligase [Calditerrivibrio sp.]